MFALDAISFPNLGITIENLPKSISVFGRFDIAFYGIIIGIGIALGYIVASFQATRTGQDKEVYLDFAMYAVIVSIIGARIYYVVFEWENYKGNFLSMINIREGGLAIYGAVIAAVIVVYFFGKYKKIDFRDLADVCAPGLILGQAIGRWGNFINQEAHGTETTLPWAVIIDGKKYHPTFLYESVGNLLIFTFLMIYMRKYQKKKGEIILFYAILYGIVRFFVEGLRTDSLMFLGFRVSQVLSLVGVLVGTILFFLNRKYGKDI